jgi:hypothetical protein
MGVSRVLKECRSGRGFLQDWAMSNNEEAVVDVGLFFETLKSKRRLALIEEINTLVAGSMPSHPETQVDELEELADFDIYAGDGHYHATSTHEPKFRSRRSENSSQSLIIRNLQRNRLSPFWRSEMFYNSLLFNSDLCLLDSDYSF